MAKHNRKPNFVHNSKEQNNTDNGANKKRKGVYVNVSREDREKAEIAVELVQDAFKLLGRDTTIVEYRGNYFNKETEQTELNVKFIVVRPVDAEGKPAGLPAYGTEMTWSAIHTKLKALIPDDRELAVKYVAEIPQFRNLV